MAKSDRVAYTDYKYSMQRAMMLCSHYDGAFYLKNQVKIPTLIVLDKTKP